MGLMTSTLSLAVTTIRQDAAGRYCLNDLHKAAGGNAKDKPANFTALRMTAALVQALGTETHCWDSSTAPLESLPGAAGRYCLNDLHKAAGDAPKHQPARFTRLAQALQLLTVLQADVQYPDVGIAPLESIHGGSQPGTYACKELVYASARTPLAATA